MPTTTKLDVFHINKLTQAQYDAAVLDGTIAESDISIITDANVSVEITNVLPPADYDHVNKLYQYIGTTNQDYTYGYFYRCMASNEQHIVSGPATVTEYINLEGNTPAPENIPTFIFDKSVFDAYLASQGLPANTGTSVTFTWEDDDATGDTNLVATYNTNDKAYTELQDEGGSPLNASYAVLGFTTNFLGWDDPETEAAVDEQYIGISGHITISLPTESSYSWQQVDVQPAVDPLPDQTGNSGKFLTTNGTTASWAIVDALPSQASQSGKLLTTNGTDASWASQSDLNLSGVTFRVWGVNE